jgi:hypothetical protein
MLINNRNLKYTKWILIVSAPGKDFQLPLKLVLNGTTTRREKPTHLFIY